MIGTDSKEILRYVQHTVADVLRLRPDDVRPDSLLGDDLGAESLDFVDLQFRLETHYGIEFYHGGVLECLAESLTPQTLEDRGLLTDFGAEVLRLRLPEVDPNRLRGGQPTIGIEALFTPRTLVRVTKEILEARPQECGHCHSVRLKLVKPSMLACNACGAEISCPTGEEVLIAWAARVPALLQEAERLDRG